MVDALRDVGYLRPHGQDDEAYYHEDCAGLFWSAYVVDEFFVLHEETAMPTAKHR